MAKLVAILNQKGGVGKTTISFNVAYALQQRGKSVLCIDMDSQANLSLLFGVADPNHNIFHLLINSIRELKALHVPLLWRELVTRVNGVDLLPAGRELSGFELTVAGISSPRQLIFKRLLELNGIFESYDFIIVDGPPTLGLIVVNIICAASGLIVPFQPDQFSRKGLSNFSQVISAVEEMNITQVPKIIGYVPNLVEGRRKLSGIEFDLIKEELADGTHHIFDAVYNKSQLSKSSAGKKSVFSYRAKEYKELQSQFLNMARRIEERA